MSALGNLQVVDLGDGIAGPIVGMFMADFGAEVVKIETPAGDPGRDAPGFAMWNRGKRSVVVDPADAAQCRWLGELISGADVCLLRNGKTLEQFKLERVALMKANPRLVLVELPPYGRAAPWLGEHEIAGVAGRRRRRRLAPILDRWRADQLRLSASALRAGAVGDGVRRCRTGRARSLGLRPGREGHRHQRRHGGGCRHLHGQSGFAGPEHGGRHWRPPPDLYALRLQGWRLDRLRGARRQVRDAAARGTRPRRHARRCAHGRQDRESRARRQCRLGQGEDRRRVWQAQPRRPAEADQRPRHPVRLAWSRPSNGSTIRR